MGGEIIFCKPTEADRIKTCDDILAKTGATFIPPFEHPAIIAGQATAAKELLEETPDLDFVLTPVGGGGLSAGTALSVKYVIPNTKVVLAEPAKADDTFRSFKSGKIETNNDPETIADGLKVTVGQLNFDIIKRHVFRSNYCDRRGNLRVDADYMGKNENRNRTVFSSAFGRRTEVQRKI